jgi:hypothetical protein
MLMTDDEVLTQTRHWLEKAVIGLNLCPFAKAVYVKNQVRLVVSHARHADDLLDELDRELDLLVATPADEVDTTLLIHPTLFEDFLDFNDFLEIAEGVVDEHGLEGVVQLASFHPKFQFDGTEPDDIGNYTNRAPFAILHLLREESIDRAVDAFPQAEAIFEENIKTLEKLGHAGWQGLGLTGCFLSRRRSGLALTPGLCASPLNRCCQRADRRDRHQVEDQAATHHGGL